MPSEIELFRPSNCDHGEWFHARFCYKCAKFPHSMEAKNQCNILGRSNAFHIDDKEYPKEWRYVDGNPVCTAFKDRDTFNAERRFKQKRTLIASTSDDLFSEQT